MFSGLLTLLLSLGLSPASAHVSTDASELKPTCEKNVGGEGGPEGTVGTSPLWLAAVADIESCAVSSRTVIITGETGTGKEVLAEHLHKISQRTGRFITQNIATVSEELTESELFGHEKGAFTGALTRHPGLFEQAHKGTLFLDEIGEIPLKLQPKLLRVLEGKGFRRMGGEEVINPEVRLIVATHRDLAEEVRGGRLQMDLYHRLVVLRVRAPSLRDRKEDVPLLVNYFLQKLAAEEGFHRQFSLEAMARLAEYHWPGNIRELRNVVECAAFKTKTSIVLPEHLEFDFEEERTAAAPTPSLAASPDQFTEFLSALGDRALVENNQNFPKLLLRQTILAALAENEWNQRAAAEVLGITRSTLRTRMQELGIERPLK
ncbi:sigma-54 dependent transcriptional regulator [bacterium]|nr:sigma-54 dependent transcriptional regulator [bacterium]